MDNSTAEAGRWARTLRTLGAVLLAALSACSGGSSDAPDVAAARAGDRVSRPEVSGPLSGGVRTQKPFGTTMVPLLDGYVEEEFLFTGRASDHVDGSEAAYTTRILVRRPSDAARFNGTVMVDWNNVTLQFDIESLWAAANDVLMGRGFIYVSVSAQKQGVDGSPLALRFFDPVRYARVSHPGDNYSYDIFSQAALAVLDPLVLPPAMRTKVSSIVGSGASQSAQRLTTYINEVQPLAGIYDGFMPKIFGSVTQIRTNLVPILWINSQAEAAGITAPPPDSGLLRYWEIAGPPHTTNAGERYYLAVQAYSHTNGAINTYDAWVAGQYGEMDPHGSCSRSRFPTRYVWSAGIVALHDWLRSGRAPPSYPPIARDATGRLTFDAHGNALGGFRLPVVDVPIAAYYAGQLPPPTATSHCAPGAATPLIGFSAVFNTQTMRALYPTHADYLAKLEPSVAEAVAAGRLLPEHAEDLLLRARGADITRPVPQLPPPLPLAGAGGR